MSRFDALEQQPAVGQRHVDIAERQATDAVVSTTSNPRSVAWATFARSMVSLNVVSRFTVAFQLAKSV